MATFINLSHIISQNTPSYGNRDRILLKPHTSLINNETSNTSTWIFPNNHIGTHIDVPYHICENGKKTFEYSIADFFFSRIGLIDIPCTNSKLISSQDFISQNGLKNNIDLLLIRTGYEKIRKEEKYWQDNPGITAELCIYLRQSFPALRCIGFDFISLTSWKNRPEGKKSHQEFLCPANGAQEILIIEDMSLKNINNNINQVIVAPIFTEDGNGGAVTVFAEINS